MPQRPLSPSGLPDEASADERLVQVSDDLPEPRLVVPLDDEEAGAPVLENIAPVSLDGLSQYPEDLGAQRAPSIELLLTRPDSAAADSAVAQSVFPGSEPISPFPGWMSVADLYEPQDQLFLPVTPMGMPVELVEPVDADLDNWTASLESPSMFLDVSPVQVAMNDTVVHDVWVDGRRPTVDDRAVETVTTTIDTATTDTTTTDTTVDTPTTTTTDTPTDTPTTATTTDTKTATTDDDDDDGGGGGGGGATPSMSIADVTTSDESATNATFTVTLSESSTSDITVNYDSSNGTGTAGADYTATSGTLTISA
ncbi:MAG TPA: Calx-beta domain-containing protein, partial [Arenicellales bacterium]|nr:Calx-beta domain-containing protein [Arenicellales bacterium]